VHLPSLRERRSDIPQLVHSFLDRYAPGDNISVEPAVMRCMLQYDWPGNIRELENCIARAVALGDRRSIDVGDLPPAIRGRHERGVSDEDTADLLSNDFANSGMSGGDMATTALADLERLTITRVFEQAGGDKALAGKMLGISRATLYRKLKRYNVPLRSSSKQLVETLH
jgi:two-component system response regulator AtoC